MLLLVEGSTGGEQKEFLGGEGQKEFAPEEMEHIQVWTEERPSGHFLELLPHPDLAFAYACYRRST